MRIFNYFKKKSTVTDITKNLSNEISSPTIAGIRKAWNNERIASGLTPLKLASVLKKANDGDSNAYLTLAEEMEEREPHYGSVIRTRRLAIESLERHIEAKEDDKKAQEIVEDIRDLVKQPIFDELVGNAMDGLSKGYSVSEIIWNTDNSKFTPVAYKWRDPRYFIFAKDDAYSLRLAKENNENGTELPEFKFITHIPRIKSGIPIRGGLARMAALSYMCKTYALTDWMSFCEVFGMPIRVGKYDNSASDEDKQTLKRAVVNIGTDAAAIIPESMQLEFIQATTSSGGDSLFENLANWLDSQMSKAVLGQTMTADNGGSLAQAQVHNEIRIDILKADAKQLATTINQQLIKPYIDFNYGVQERYPYFEFYVPEPEDIDTLVKGVKELVPLGLKVSQAFMRDKLGIPDPLDNEELLTTNNSDEEKNTAEVESNAVALNTTENISSELEDYINLTKQAIDKLVAKLEKAKNFTEILELLNTVELDSEDITEALAIAGVKAFADGASSE